MRKIVRNYSKILAGVLLTVLLAACGTKKSETTAISSPAPVVFYSHSVAISSSPTPGSIYSWGVNTYGQLGNGGIAAKSTPVAVLAGAAGPDNLTGMKGVSAGGTHTLAFVESGSVYAWGNNWFGELGDTSITARTKPVQVRINDTDPPAFLDGITAVAAGGNQYSLALDSSHVVWAWGSNRLGQLGLALTTLQQKYAKSVFSLLLPDTITMIAAGGSHSLALSSDKTVWSWGLNVSGQLGRGLPYTNIPTPGQVVKEADITEKLANVIHIAAGGGHSLFVTGDGNVWACGLNYYGQLGDGTTINRKDGVVQIINDWYGNPFTGATAVAAGLDHSLALIGGTVWAWGSNTYGQLGNPINFNTDIKVTSPVKVLKVGGDPLENVTKIVAIGNHSLALVDDGSNPPTVWAWGDNTYGQVGNGKTTDSTYAIEITGITDPDLYMPVP